MAMKLPKTVKKLGFFGRLRAKIRRFRIPMVLFLVAVIFGSVSLGWFSFLI